MPNPIAVLEADQKRIDFAREAAAIDEWRIEEVANTINLSLKRRMAVATHYLQTQVVRNISVSVKKSIVNGKIVVTERSQPGEFPRMDTGKLMRSVIRDVQNPAFGIYDGFVGTKSEYGVKLELEMGRVFLKRTFYDALPMIEKALTGPAIPEYQKIQKYVPALPPDADEALIYLPSFKTGSGHHGPKMGSHHKGGAPLGSAAGELW